MEDVLKIQHLEVKIKKQNLIMKLSQVVAGICGEKLPNKTNHLEIQTNFVQIQKKVIG